MVLLFFCAVSSPAQTSAPRALPQKGEAKAAKKQETTKKTAPKGAKPMVSPAVAEKPKPAKRTSEGMKVIYIKTAAPWYTNPWILFFVGSILLLSGGFIGRVLSFGPIPRREKAGEEVAEQKGQEDWLKNIFKCFRRKSNPITI